MALDGVSGRVFREAAIPVLTDVATSTTTRLSHWESEATGFHGKAASDESSFVYLCVLRG